MAASFTLTLTASEIQMALCAVDNLKDDLYENQNLARHRALLRVRAKLTAALDPRQTERA